MNNHKTIKWILSGDVAVQYQAYRDLLGKENKSLRHKIALEGWGARFMSKRKNSGHWGIKFYQPKWTSTHYTILDLKNLNISPDNPEIKQTLNMIFAKEKGPDGGILPIGMDKKCDVCLNGMVLNYASYFGVNQEDLKSIVDFLLSERMQDGGFNCRSNRSGAVHSSLHTTLSVTEGTLEYTRNRYTYRLTELQEAEQTSREFILQHRLYKSDKTGEVIDKKMTLLSFPSRWRYDILRALDYFQSAGIAYDSRMDDAVEILLKKRKQDGRWPLQGRHPGQTHFDMEKTGQLSRWNTLRVLRVFKHFNISG